MKHKYALGVAIFLLIVAVVLIIVLPTTCNAPAERSTVATEAEIVDAKQKVLNLFDNLMISEDTKVFQELKTSLIEGDRLRMLSIQQLCTAETAASIYTSEGTMYAGSAAISEYKVCQEKHYSQYLQALEDIYKKY